jgi:hypothetical protein
LPYTPIVIASTVALSIQRKHGTFYDGTPARNNSTLASRAVFCHKARMFGRCLLLFTLGLAVDYAPAATNAPTADAVKAALARSTDYLTAIATQGGYLWRYSADLQDRRGEAKATAAQIWVQPPGTPSVGMAFLHAYAATKDERHLTAAHAAARALACGQLESGGWAYLVEFDPKGRRNWSYRTDATMATRRSTRASNATTFDDDNTQSALRFLMAYLVVATNWPAQSLTPIRHALEYGLAKMIEAQYPNGAWPQRYNGTPHDPRKHPIRPSRVPANWPRTWPKTDYSGYYTLNDQTQRDCIRTMIEAWKRLGDRRYLDAARKGGDFLILARLPEPQAGWAQQYNFAMEPAWARAFEPAAVCSAESAGVIRTLVDLFLETGDAKFLEPLPGFVAWLKRSEIKPGQWARFYELQTNKPIYGDRDGKVHYTLAEISRERQGGYSWQGSYGIPGVIKDYEAVMAQGRKAFLATRQKNNGPTKPAENVIARILAQQDSQGRWLKEGWVDIRTFIRNMQALGDYLLAR